MANSFKVRIGVREIAAMQPNTVLWDIEVRGFCARRQFSEIITYSVIFRNRDGRQHWFKLGRHPILTPHLARQEAIKVLRAVTLGEDPSAERKARRSGLTVAELCDEYQRRENGKKPATLTSDKSRIKMHIRPKLGHYRVATITTEMIEDFTQGISAGSKRRMIGLLGAIFAYATKRKIRPDNPVRGIEKPAEVKRMRRLSDAEYQHFGDALNGSAIHDIFLLLAVTGWRSSEAKNLRWTECDLERSTVILGESKTGLSVRPLSGAAIDIIKRQPQTSEYVFPNQHGKNLHHGWRKLGLARDISPHTLRHSFASLAADMGFSDNTIASLLGHSRGSITSRYLHGSDKALIAATDSVANETMRLMRP
jgi:integrase